MNRLVRSSFAAALASAVSLAMCAQNALLLLQDPVTGERHCVSRLPGLLGLEPDSGAASVVNVASEAWLVLIPLAVVLAVLALIQRRRTNFRRQPSRATGKGR